ncbi:aminoglycoside phosphotransferase [Methanocorpusculum labreanum Z]|uniref:Aminoglycoside phosphotransferase n=1 Tax=Methanocorpusculum labreanum (strain ATCC 43576 / DSM 4855 / Z) TaxID=410358 RepID=A2SU90_METLZ|nr:phosphotransferase [Methanocorpusculum labreanum]ABN07896.1 aminoglycoside phosphotransferase [Methanocorpusculum labreanum Z]
MPDEIPNQAFTEITPILKGWSDDAKYRVKTDDGRKLLLRVSAIDKYDRKKEEFEALQTIESLEIPAPKPIAFGRCRGNASVYMLLSWTEGKEAEDVLPLLSKEEQYNIGIKAGNLQKRLNSIPAPKDMKPWGVRFGKKLDWKCERYLECGICFEHDDLMLAYIEEHRHLIQNRPQCFQHGDFHCGNLIISEEGEPCIIDFNRIDYGDPWEEFNRIVWCAKRSIYFAAGRIDGYFEGSVPDEFWDLLLLYISSNTLSSIPWSIPFGQKEVDTAVEMAKEVLFWYDDMKSSVPCWYVEAKKDGAK